MPQLTLEYTGNIDQRVNFTALFSALHQVLAELGGVHIENCKSRAVRRDDFYIGSGEPGNAFVHLDVTMLEGRSLALKQAVGAGILRILQQTFAPAMATHDLQITVEIKDIKRATYFKVPEGTFTPQG